MSTYDDLRVHRWMLRDRVRNEAYQRALARAVRPGDVVLELGAGSGILSVFAALAGARKVYAVERAAVIEVARRLVARNGLADRIELIAGDLEDVRLPERADVLVSEWMGGFGVDENMLAPLVMARDRWLAPGGRIVPGRVTAWLAPVELASFDEELAYWRARPHGVDLGEIADATVHETFHTQAHLAPEDLVAAPQALWSHDAHACALDEADRPFVARLTFPATRAGAISGLAAWFTADMGGGETLTNAIGEPDTHWGRTFFPLDRPVAVAAGAPVEVELACDPSVSGSCEFAWALRTGDHAEAHDTRPARQARLRAEARRAAG